jgi:hypothetical protein
VVGDGGGDVGGWEHIGGDGGIGGGIGGGVCVGGGGDALGEEQRWRGGMKMLKNSENLRKKYFWGQLKLGVTYD